MENEGVSSMLQNAVPWAEGAGQLALPTEEEAQDEEGQDEEGQE